MPVSKTKIISMMLVSRPVIALVITTVIIFGGFSLYPTIVDYIHSRDGVYGPWSEWSGCLRYCGESYKGRYRQCVQPARGFGKPCDSFGPYVETSKCNNGACPVDGGVAPWGPWDTKCDKDCKGGQLKRRRQRNNPKELYHSEFPDEPLLEIKSCPSTKECPIDAKMSEWGASAPCTLTCGGGKRIRKRTCAPPKYGGKTCKVVGSTEDIRPCNIRECPVDGKLSEWGAFTTCTKTCGGGTMTRKRTCAPPKFGGKACDPKVNTEDVQKCNTGECSKFTTKPKAPATPKPAATEKAAAAPKPADAQKTAAAPKPADTPKTAAAPKPADTPKTAAAPKPADTPKTAAAPKPAATPNPAAVAKPK